MLLEPLFAFKVSSLFKCNVYHVCKFEGQQLTDLVDFLQYLIFQIRYFIALNSFIFVSFALIKLLVDIKVIMLMSLFIFA